jgi:glycosyltransferase involved in cell wall biosynthesis
VSKRILIGIYHHPEAYPPTLNAVQQLSRCYEEIIIVHRPHLKSSWNYPANVTVVESGKPISSVDQERASLHRKVFFFLIFFKDFVLQSWKKKPGTILLYDTMPVLAFSLARPLLWFKYRLWYHNHDIAELSQVRKYSLGWWACRAERKIFKRLHLFTLPAESRKQFFPLETSKAACIVIPNYPSRQVYDAFYRGKNIEEKLILIFQGRVNEGHGFETIIPLLSETIEGKKLELVLKGYITEEYKRSLLALAATAGVEGSLRFVGFGPYKDVPEIASGCHIGIGIFSAREIMHLTLGTSSNKLYEYAALGLPVLYSDEKHFTDYLGKYEWAVPVIDNDPESIKTAISKIIRQYERLSADARTSFESHLNFEYIFEPVLSWTKREA